MVFFLFFSFFLFLQLFLELWVDCRFEWSGPTMFRWVFCTPEYMYEDGLREWTIDSVLNTRREEMIYKGIAISQLCYATPSVQREPALTCLYERHHDYEEKVELIVPNLMFEKVTVESALFFSTSAGAPESLGQVPRLTPGVLSVALVG